MTRLDEMTIAAARRRDEQAWVDIYGDLAPRLAGYMRGMRLQESDVDDVVGETLANMVKSIDSFSGGVAELRAWAYAIARNACFDLLRGERRRADGRPEPGLDAPTHADSSPGAALMDRERLSRLLSVLTERQQEVMLLRVVGDLTVEQVAYVMGERVGTIKALQRRAIKALRTQLENEYAA